MFSECLKGHQQGWAGIFDSTDLSTGIHFKFSHQLADDCRHLPDVPHESRVVLRELIPETVLKLQVCWLMQTHHLHRTMKLHLLKRDFISYAHQCVCIFRVASSKLKTILIFVQSEKDKWNSAQNQSSGFGDYLWKMFAGNERLKKNMSDSSSNDAPHKAEAALTCVSKSILPTNSGRQGSAVASFRAGQFQNCFPLSFGIRPYSFHRPHQQIMIHHYL